MEECWYLRSINGGKNGSRRDRKLRKGNLRAPPPQTLPQLVRNEGESSGRNGEGGNAGRGVCLGSWAKSHEETTHSPHGRG